MTKKINAICYSNKWMNFKDRRKNCFQKVKKSQKFNKIVKSKNQLHNKSINRKFLMSHKDSRIWIMDSIPLKIIEKPEK